MKKKLRVEQEIREKRKSEKSCVLLISTNLYNRALGLYLTEA